jgi:circadian clock protein KaiC
MKLKQPNNGVAAKARTGIEGFDEISNGGLPRGRTTLIEGGPGSGKTIFALQTLVSGAHLHKEPGIFVAFEESPERIAANAEKFGWEMVKLQKDRFFFLDARPAPELVQSGTFDLGGMLAVLKEKAREMKAQRIVFDALDVVFALLNDPLAVQREMYRLHDWLLASGLTAIITSKTVADETVPSNQPKLGFVQFMVDCSVVLKHEVVKGVSQRSLRVVKFRGSSFAENESPFLIGPSGLEVAGARESGGGGSLGATMLTERVSSGVQRLDAMLGGGYYRGAGILITGFPGTAKSTLGGSFVQAACLRGERTLLISFDSDADEVVRNLISVNIRLARFVKKGLLRLVSARAITGSAEIHLMQIKNHAKEHRARCVVIDPVSALAKAGNEDTAYSVAERLVDWAKAEKITLLYTSLLHEAWTQMEGTPLQISTIADTWIHLSYLVHAGERNRGLSIIKSRGTSHSNQVRELMLSKQGVTLADAYTAGGEVLMGTLRWEKELAELAAKNETQTMAKRKKAELELEETEIALEIKKLQRELDAKRSEKLTSARLTMDGRADAVRGRDHMSRLRGSDALE